MNQTRRMPNPVPTSTPVFPRGHAVRCLLLLLPAALLFALPLSAASARVDVPGVSVETDDQGRTEVRVPGVSVSVNEAQEPALPLGPSIDLSGTWKFSEDMAEEGHLKGWQNPEFDDSAWRGILVPGDWEKAGVLKPNPKWRGYQPDDDYNGYGWYRRHFTVPADWADAVLTLRFGAIDDWDWTYVNGQLVGTTTGEGTWDDPRDYAIPLGVLKPGEDNVIAVRVCDMGGGGGLSEPPVELINTSLLPAETDQPVTRSYSRTRPDIVLFGSSASVGADEKVNGDVVVFGGSASIDGYVTGDVVAVGGSIHLGPGSRVDGNAVAIGASIDRADGAVIRGDVVEVGHTIDLPRALFAGKGLPLWGVAGVSASILTILAWGFVALLGVLLMKDRLAVMAEALPAHPARAALYGLIGFALTPAAILTAVVASVLASVLLAITIVGIPLIPAVLAALVALIVAGGLLVVAGVIAIWFSLGKAAFSLVGSAEVRPIWAVLIGVALIAIASHIPVLGPLVVVTIIIFGFGLAIMTGLGSHSEWAPRRLGSRGAPPVPPAAPVVAAPAPPALAEEPVQPEEPQTEPHVEAEPEPTESADYAGSPDLAAEPEPPAEAEAAEGDEIEEEPEAEPRDS